MSHRYVERRDVARRVRETFEGGETELLHLLEPHTGNLLRKGRTKRLCEHMIDLGCGRRHLVDLGVDIEDRLFQRGELACGVCVDVVIGALAVVVPSRCYVGCSVKCQRYCTVEASAFAARGARIFAIAVIWSTAAFCAASCWARRARIVSMDAGGGSGVAGVSVGVASGAGVTSRASRSSPDEELSLLTTIVLTLLC